MDLFYIPNILKENANGKEISKGYFGEDGQ